MDTADKGIVFPKNHMCIENSPRKKEIANKDMLT